MLTTYTYDAANQLLTSEDDSGVTTYTYDAEGNRTRKETPTAITDYTWDEDNRMILAEPVAGDVSFTYNADGQRVRKETTTDTTKFIYDFKKLLQETDGSDTAEHSYTGTLQEYGDLVSEHDEGSGSTSYHQYDALGSTDALVDENESTTDTYKYRGFGLATHESGSSETPHTFVGRQNYYHDPEIELFFLGIGGAPNSTPIVPNNRNGNTPYAAQTGTFLRPDPVDDDENRYRYVRNNPINRVDPSGLLCTSASRAPSFGTQALIGLRSFGNPWRARRLASARRALETAKALRNDVLCLSDQIGREVIRISGRQARSQQDVVEAFAEFLCRVEKDAESGTGEAKYSRIRALVERSQEAHDQYVALQAAAVVLDPGLSEEVGRLPLQIGELSSPEQRRAFTIALRGANEQLAQAVALYDVAETTLTIIDYALTAASILVGGLAAAPKEAAKEAGEFAVRRFLSRQVAIQIAKETAEEVSARFILPEVADLLGIGQTSLYMSYVFFRARPRFSLKGKKLLGFLGRKKKPKAPKSRKPSGRSRPRATRGRPHKDFDEFIEGRGITDRNEALRAWDEYQNAANSKGLIIGASEDIVEHAGQGGKVVLNRRVWTANINIAWLDGAIDAGLPVDIITAGDEAFLHSGLSKEINYLLNHGYELLQGQLVPR